MNSGGHMGHLGFSYIGLIYLLMLFIPNLIWARNKPKGYTGDHENKILSVFEKTGQVLVTATVLIFSDLNFKGFDRQAVWFFASAVLMLLYECWWIRYFQSGRTLTDFYSSFLGVPVAGASLPVLAFLCLAVYGRVLWLLISTLILGIGHIGIHLEHLKKLNNSR